MINKPAPITSIDTDQLTRFTGRHKRRLGIPPSILEEYSLANGSAKVKSTMETTPPFSQFQSAEGYEFTWGCVLERRVDRYIIWDFCFNQLLTHYLRAGKRLTNLQRDFYSELERRICCATRDILPVLGMDTGWKIIPCSAVAAFTEVVHFTNELEAREWTSANLIYGTILDIIARLQKNA